jgi:hypothetical protein
MGAACARARGCVLINDDVTTTSMASLAACLLRCLAFLAFLGGFFGFVECMCSVECRELRCLPACLPASATLCRCTFMQYLTALLRCVSLRATTWLAGWLAGELAYSLQDLCKGTSYCVVLDAGRPPPQQQQEEEAGVEAAAAAGPGLSSSPSPVPDGQPSTTPDADADGGSGGGGGGR